MIEKFSTLFKEIERDIGTKDLNLLVLGALKDAFYSYKGDTIEELFAQMQDILQTINNTEPKFAIVIDNVFRVFEQIHDCVKQAEQNDRHNYKEYSKCIIGTVESAINEADWEWKNLLKCSESLNLNGKTILIYDQSHTVQSVLQHLKNRRQNFKVVVGEQDMEKTLANIEFLIENDINFVSVPDYMLSNLEDEIDMCFFGALTLKSTFDFVTSNGTNALISQFSQLQKPIYLFLTSSKFSLWEADKKQSVNQHQHKRKHPLKDLTFDRIKFSHDRVPADKVTYTVTEEGVLNNANLKEVYNRKFEEHKLITDKLQSLGDNFYET